MEGQNPILNTFGFCGDSIVVIDLLSDVSLLHFNHAAHEKMNCFFCHLTLSITKAAIH